MLKVILITVIEWENSIDDIDKIVDMLENNESKGPDEYHSDDEDHKQSTAKNNLEVWDLKSDISHPISLSKRKHSLTTFDHQQFVRHNLLLNSNQSRVSSWVRLDPIEKFRQINNSVESSEEWKVVTKNVANLNLYIPSNRINTESMNSNRMKHYSFRKSKRLIDSYRSSKSDLQNILVINVNKAEENDYNSNTQQLNSKRQNEDMQKVGLIRIEEEGPQFLNSSAEYIYKLKKQLQEKYKSSNDLNQNGENIMREKNIENMYKHFLILFQ